MVALSATLFSMAPMADVGAESAPDPGQGTAFAQAFKVDPKAGGLSIGVAFGQSTATHANQVAKAVSTSTNLGVVGLTLGAEPCDGSNPTWARKDQPQPTTIDSRDADAAAGKRENEKYNGNDMGPGFVKSVRATTAPFGQAETTIMGGGGAQGDNAIQLGNAVTRSSSGLVDGVREARATAELEYLEVRGGGRSLRLNALRWEAVHRSTGTPAVDGSFTIGAAIVNGVPMSAPIDEAAMLQNADAILKPMGLKLVPGSMTKTDDRVTVEPLAITVVPDPTRDTVAKTALAAIHPVREMLITQILTTKVDVKNATGRSEPPNVDGCRAGTYISVVDIVVGSLTGAGEFVLSLGGAEATTGVSPTNDFNLAPGASGSIGGFDIPGEPAVDSLFIAPDTVSGPIAAIAPTIDVALDPTRTRIVRPAVPAGHTKPFKGKRGGALALVGLVTLGVLAVVAEGDRRTMRAQRRATEAAG